MSKDTLETLKMDLEVKVSILWGKLTNRPGLAYTNVSKNNNHRLVIVDEVARQYCDPNDTNSLLVFLELLKERGPNKFVDDCFLATKLYVVARDQGLDAAMLWKLAN